MSQALYNELVPLADIHCSFVPVDFFGRTSAVYRAKGSP